MSNNKTLVHTQMEYKLKKQNPPRDVDPWGDEGLERSGKSPLRLSGFYTVDIYH